MSRIVIVLLAMLSISLISPAARAELSQAELQELLKDRIEGLKFLTKNALLLDAVREQNRQGMTLDEIKKIDAEWRAGTSPLIEELQTTKVGSFLKNIVVQQSGVYNEVFLTDAQGANVATYPATSDYWQGDEEKFTAAFANGEGKVFVGPAEFDESTKSNAVQISVPMLYNNEAVGVLVIGVKISALEAEKLQGK